MDKRQFLRLGLATWAAPGVAATQGERLDELQGGAAGDVQPVIDTLVLPSTRIELQFEPGFSPALRAQARAWVTQSAQTVADYLGRFPVPAFELLLRATPEDGVGSGVSFGGASPLVRVRLGVQATARQLAEDWVLVHEMVHLAVPQLPRAQRWLHEGLATYVSGVARARASQLAETALWQGYLWGMPQGQPQVGDQGLDHTPTWGRIYWGGALFCLLADVRLRERSGNRQGLQQALQGLQAAGGSYAVAWPADRVLATADAAVGQTTLTDLYRLMKDCPTPVDLAALWHDLGVEALPGGGLALHDDAPLAALRRAIAA